MIELTPKQQRFVEQHLIDPNAPQAAVSPGHSTRTARRLAAENLKKPEIEGTVAVVMKAYRIEELPRSVNNVNPTRSETSS